MEFDYQRWRAWTTWRESARGSSPPIIEGRCGRPRRRDCWRECEYPSECHHSRTMRRGKVDVGRRSVATVDEEARLSPISSPALSPCLGRAVPGPGVEVNQGRPVSVAGGSLEEDDSFIRMMEGQPGLEQCQTTNPVIRTGSLMSVLTGRLMMGGEAMITLGSWSRQG
ncbi:uncharacterized protein ColSpa_12462 [Colletotrichum spaethianum]|uniref:Uncharacterized protein n=1 Tax=Colletotrichum spaethianum TaxID=700344 RepID=A0AA37PH80_9PEZI|nr:uncharacterized protein ColSpa_12462 [Colletotrichum spaethianum]GKT52281.1 hypothetical protein ColSpa_12462 [Colletotrichum spaethianum]